MTLPIYSAPLDEVTTAVLELFRATGRDVWDGAYSGSPTRPTYPHHLLYRVLGGSSDPLPDLDGDPRDVTLAYQLTTVSNVRNQCEHAARTARDRYLARTPSGGFIYGMDLPDGWTDIDRRPDPAMPGIDRAGETPNAIFTLPQRFYLTISPS